MSLRDSFKHLEVEVTKEMTNNLRVMVGEYQIAAKHYAQVVSPLASLINRLESGELLVVTNPEHPANILKAIAPTPPAPAANNGSTDKGHDAMTNEGGNLAADASVTSGGGTKAE